MLTNDDIKSIKNIIDPIKSDINSIKSDLVSIKTDMKVSKMVSKVLEDRTGALQYDNEDIKKLIKRAERKNQANHDDLQESINRVADIHEDRFDKIDSKIKVISKELNLAFSD